MVRPRRKSALYTAALPADEARSAGARDAGTRRDEPRRSARGVDETRPADRLATDKRAKTRQRPPFSLGARWLLLSSLMLAAVLYALAPWRTWIPRHLTQQDIDEAVLKTLNDKPIPAPGAKAYANVIGSVVRVIGMVDDSEKTVGDANQIVPPKRQKDEIEMPRGGNMDERSRARPAPRRFDEDDDKNTVGTGVVIIDNGTILTNMHVVMGAKRVKVEFADGLMSDADVVGMRPEHDLAVLRARRIPDDLKAATMRSTADLRPGDRVTAVGFPFGIGPSVSHGVVSGLKRSFRSPEGGSVLSNLIQFDAAANPGNSGGPLVTDDGEVVGIVTAIYNPTAQRFFVGLGFAVPIENAAQAAGMPPF